MADFYVRSIGEPMEMAALRGSRERNQRGRCLNLLKDASSDDASELSTVVITSSSG